MCVIAFMEFHSDKENYGIAYNEMNPSNAVDLCSVSHKSISESRH